jgi:hypothetical protein
VRFRWKNYRQPDHKRVMTLDADEFIRRFLQHTLPDGFRRIRHFGLLANTHRTARLATIRQLLAVPLPIIDDRPRDYRDRYAALTGRRLDVCPCCGGRMVETATLARTPRPSSPMWYDSS